MMDELRSIYCEGDTYKVVVHRGRCPGGSSVCTTLGYAILPTDDSPGRLVKCNVCWNLWLTDESFKSEVRKAKRAGRSLRPVLDTETQLR
jgi:putative lipase involved disintegration of autophagic bodies